MVIWQSLMAIYNPCEAGFTTLMYSTNSSNPSKLSKSQSTWNAQIEAGNPQASSSCFLLLEARFLRAGEE